jgi:hypothetical protein
MSTMTSRYKGLLTRYLLCWGVLLASLVLFPLLAWSSFEVRWLPEPVMQVLFFWPQYLFLPFGVRQDAALGESTYGASGVIYATATFWMLSVAAYVWVTRHFNARWVVAALLPVVYVLLQAVVFGALALFDLHAVLSGP